MGYLYDAPNLSTGMDEVIVGIATTIPAFTPMLLMFVFIVVTIGSSTAQRKRSGSIDFAAATILGSIAMLLIALPMTLISGLINLEILSIVITINILSGIWFFMSHRSNE